MFKQEEEVSQGDGSMNKEIMEKLEEINGGVIQTQAMMRGRIIR